ncbi:hypothetical protein [Legionella tunisiensis]|uniref:hypothetical protein n=1 Tax=Legionella tunisiensis TaxID=1034944 RepID=UPI0003626A07|nr:hypothetical protein [Legionella tunisiensis]
MFLALYGDNINAMHHLSTGEKPGLVNPSVAIYNSNDFLFTFPKNKFISCKNKPFSVGEFNNYLSNLLDRQLREIFGTTVILVPYLPMSDTFARSLRALQEFQATALHNPFRNHEVRIVSEKEYMDLEQLPENIIYLYLEEESLYQAKFSLAGQIILSSFEHSINNDLVDEFAFSLEPVDIILNFALLERERVVEAVISRDQITNLVKHIDCGTLATNLYDLLSHSKRELNTEGNHLDLPYLLDILRTTEEEGIPFFSVDGFAGHVFTILPVNDEIGTSEYCILQSNTANELQRQNAYNGKQWVENNKSERVYTLETLVDFFNEFYDADTQDDRKIAIYEELFSLAPLSIEEKKAILSKVESAPIHIYLCHYQPQTVSHKISTRLLDFQPPDITNPLLVVGY